MQEIGQVSRLFSNECTAKITILFFLIRPRDPEAKDDENRPGSSASSSRSQNMYVDDRSLSRSRSPISPISLSSSVLVQNVIHTTCNCNRDDLYQPSRLLHSAHTPQRHNSHYPEEPVQQVNDPYPQVINLEDLADRSTAGVPLQSCPRCHDVRSTSAGDQELRGNRRSWAESSLSGDDVSMNDSEFQPRPHFRMESQATMRSTPSSGYHSSSLSRLRHNKAPPTRKRHNTEGHPIATLLQLPTNAGGGYLVLHGLDLRDLQHTSSTSQLQHATVLQVGASNLVQVQPAMSAEMQESFNDNLETTSLRSRDHLRLTLSGGGLHFDPPPKQLITGVPGVVLSPYRRHSDPSPLSGSPKEYCEQGETGEEFHCQNMSGSESTSSADTSIL